MIKEIKLDGKKDISIVNDLVDFSNVSKVFVPLINCNILCKCLTKKGRKVKIGSVIGIREDINFPILSPVSGVVLDIKKYQYLNGDLVDCVVISNDKTEKILKKNEVKDICNYSKEEFIDLLKKCSVSGMGGGDFPTYLKYEGNSSILIVNAVECEPYLTSDAMICKLKSKEILDGIDAILKINKMDKCLIAYKKNNNVVKNSFLEYIESYDNIILTPVDDFYPAGWEKNIIKSVLGYSYSKYPSEIGIVVNNVSTIYSIYKALKYKKGISKRIVTISGDGFSKPVNVLVKIGTNMASIIKKIGSYEGDNLRFIAGGPMMGTSLPKDELIVSKNLGAVTIINNDEYEEINKCISCGKCIDKCPANICPALILKNIDDVLELKKLHPEKCIGCGICSYICPSKLALRDAVKIARKKVE